MPQQKWWRDSGRHGRPVCRAQGLKCPSRFCETNVKSLILTIGASPDLDSAPRFINLQSQFS